MTARLATLLQLNMAECGPSMEAVTEQEDIKQVSIAKPITREVVLVSESRLISRVSYVDIKARD